MKNKIFFMKDFTIFFTKDCSCQSPFFLCQVRLLSFRGQKPKKSGMYELNKHFNIIIVSLSYHDQNEGSQKGHKTCYHIFDNLSFSMLQHNYQENVLILLDQRLEIIFYIVGRSCCIFYTSIKFHIFVGF